MLLALFLLFSTNNCYAVTEDDSASSENINAHGYSPEVTRIIELQKDQVNEQSRNPKDYVKCKYIKYAKKQFSNPDLTEPVDEFGKRIIE